MRLLFFTAEHWPTFRADVAVLFGKYLPRQGIRADLVAGRDSGQQAAVPWNGGDAHLCELPRRRSLQYVRVLWHALRHMFAARRDRHDALQVRDMPVAAAFAVLACKLKGLPLYYWMSYPLPEGQLELARARGLSAGLMKYLFPWISGHLGVLLLRHWVLPHADHVFVQSEQMLTELAEAGVPRAKMSPVPMGVDVERIDAAPPVPIDHPLLAGRRVVVYLGTIDRPRQFEHLLDAIVRVREHIPGVLLVVAGDTADAAYRQQIQHLVQRLGLGGHVLFTGWLATDLAWRHVAAAELGLSPVPRGKLLDCGSPTKVAEYLALGIPVLCNDNPDQRHLIESSGAGLCVPYDPASFADAMVCLLNRPPEELRRMGRAGRAFIGRERSYAVIAGQLARVYRALGSGA